MGNAGSGPEAAGEAKKAAEAELESRRQPAMVRFPDAGRQKIKQVPPITLEAEDIPPAAADENMAPRNLWQVYAIGAFMVLRWAWARWKERKEREESPDDESPDGSST